MNKLLLAAVAVAAFLILGATWAIARDDAVPPPPAQPTSADQIQNIDQVKTAIKAYYGDTLTQTPAPQPPGSPTVYLHTFSSTGAYAQEMAGLEQDAEHYLADQAKHFNGPGPDGHGPCGKGGPDGNKPGPPPPPPHPGPVPGPSPNPAGKCGTPAILLDVDDTTLNTYSYEIFSNFVYNPTTNANFVLAADPAVFPAVPGMPDLVNQARAEGYAIIVLTGRPVAQAQATLNNLSAAGYGTIDPNLLFTKDVPNLPEPWLASCAPSCSTSQYKTLTRQHIETDLGYDIVANFGDQYSDLVGDFADRTFKLPNPMYFLP